MPLRSKSQSRLMHAVDNDPSLAASTGVKASIAHEFVEAGHGISQAKLPEHVPHKKAEGGRIPPGYPPKFRW